MQEEKTQAYLDFLRFSLNDSAPVPESARNMDWNGLLDFGRKQAISGVLYHGLERMGDSPYKPDHVTILKWYATYAAVKKLNVQVYRDASRLTTGLYRDFLVKSCVLKGQGNAIMYPDPYMRSPGDIDIWCQTQTENGADSGQKESTNKRKNYFWTVDPEIVKLIKIARQQDKQGEIGYHHIELNVLQTPVELHFFPSFMGNIVHEKRLRQWFEEHKSEQFTNIVRLPDDLGTICVPTDGFNRVFQLSHLMHHFFFEGIGLRQIVDYYYLLRRGFTPEEKQETLDVLRRVGMLKFASGLMYIMKYTLGLEDEFLLMKPHERIGRLLLSEIILSGNFGFSDERYSFQGMSPYRQYFLEIYRNLHFALDFPSETLWGRPISRWWHALYKIKLRKAIQENNEAKK